MSDREWWTILECCEVTRRSPQTIRVYIRRGLLRASQPVPNGHVLVSRRSLEDLLSRRINRPANRP